MAAPDWAVWVSPIASFALGAFGAWVRDRMRLERMQATETEREKHISYRFTEASNNRAELDARLRRLEDRPANGYSALVERLRQCEEFIDELREWKDTRGEPYQGSLNELTRRVEACEREIGDHQSGIRGWIHKKGNQITAQLQAIEAERRRNPRR